MIDNIFYNIHKYPYNDNPGLYQISTGLRKCRWVTKFTSARQIVKDDVIYIDRKYYVVIQVVIIPTESPGRSIHLICHELGVGDIELSFNKGA